MKVFIDMDGVLADFQGSPLFTEGDQTLNNPPRMYEKRFFETLPVVDGALWAVRELLNIEGIEVHILTQPVLNTHYSYSEKASWVAKYFPELISKLHLTQNKEFFSQSGRVLVDDCGWKWKEKWKNEGGEFIKFDSDIDPRKMWEDVVVKVQELVSSKNELPNLPKLATGGLMATKETIKAQKFINRRDL
jgi:5'(3')-deoxyribonucleotidase